MKKTLLILALALSLNLSYAQRSVDWELLEILTPTELRSGNQSTPLLFQYTFVCKNNSTDPVFASDTLGYHVICFNGLTGSTVNDVLWFFPNPINTIQRTPLLRNCDPGDTIHIRGSLTVGLRVSLSRNVRIFASVEVFNRADMFPRELTGTFSNNTKTKPMIWYNEQGWGVSINDINKDILSVYPNPATSNLTINLDLVGNNNSFEIFDMSGKLVKADALNNFDGSQEINVSEFSKGVYILKANNGSQIYTTKFIVE